jgi:hypothetical protein
MDVERCARMHPPPSLHFSECITARTIAGQTLTPSPARIRDPQSLIIITSHIEAERNNKDADAVLSKLRMYTDPPA